MTDRDLIFGVVIGAVLGSIAFDLRGKLHRFVASLRGKNGKWTSSSVITEQMKELRPLPMGVAEFHEWSERIISGACIPGASPESQKFALAEMIMHLKPVQDHCDDAHFIHTLRKGAVNQVAYAMMEEIRNARKAELAAKDNANALGTEEPKPA
jgi:hypothetical protein